MYCSRMANASNSSRSVNDMISFLEGTLIPDLRESGADATADDFEECVGFMRSHPDAVAAGVRVTRRFSLGINDKGGRLIGAFAEVGPNRFQSQGGRTVRVQPTRDGRGFGGACPYIIIEGGPEAEEAEVQRRLKGMCKSYGKKFGDGKPCVAVLVDA